MRLSLPVGLACAALLLGGCGGDEHAEPDPAQLACDRVGEAAREVTASAARDDTAPLLAFDGAPVQVALPAGAAGHVRVETDAPEELGILLVDQTDALAAVWRGDTAATPVSAGPDPFCPDELPEHFDIDFEVAGTHYLELGPTASDSVRILLAEGAGHGD